MGGCSTSNVAQIPIIKSLKSRAENSFIMDTEYDELFQKVHWIDGCDAQIDMFENYTNDPDFLNNFKDFRIGKLPAKCSGILQPNDLMEGFKLIKKPLKKKKTKESLFCPLDKQALSNIALNLQGYMEMKSITSNLLLKFLERAGSIFNDAFDEGRVISGYKKGGYTDYSRRKVLQLCRNRFLDLEAIQRIIEENEAEFFDHLNTKGILPDAVMEKCGIPGLNKLAHNKDELKTLELIFNYGNEDGRRNLPLNPEMYEPKDLEYIQSFPENSYTKNLLIYILKKKSIEANPNGSVAQVNNLQVINVDPYKINRQRAMFFIPGYTVTHNARIQEFRELEKRQQEEDLRQANQLIEARKNSKAILRKLAALKYSSLYQCQWCDSVYKIIPEEENASEEENTITENRTIAELLESEEYMIRQEQVCIERHTFWGYLQNWQHKPRLVCARCVSVQLYYYRGDLPPQEALQELINMKADNNLEIKRYGYLHWADFLEVRRKKMRQISDSNSDNANNNNHNRNILIY